MFYIITNEYDSFYLLLLTSTDIGDKDLSINYYLSYIFFGIALKIHYFLKITLEWPGLRSCAAAQLRSCAAALRYLKYHLYSLRRMQPSPGFFKIPAREGVPLALLKEGRNLSLIKKGLTL
jgi:hypothetical protein